MVCQQLGKEDGGGYTLNKAAQIAHIMFLLWGKISNFSLILSRCNQWWVGSELVSRLHCPRCINKLAGKGRVIKIAANITGGWAARNVVHTLAVKNQVDLTLPHYSITSNPPGILEENHAVSLNVVSNWGLSCTARRCVRTGNGKLDDVLTTFGLAAWLRTVTMIPLVSP